METSEEKKSAESKSKSQWCEVAVISLIAVVVLISGAWLWKMSDVLKSPPGRVEVRHVYANFSTDNKKGVEKEETQYSLYKQAEETLREQMNTWLTIVGFFGVLFGLIVPLASYLLQRRSLSEERERIMEGVKESAAGAAEKAAEKASKEAADAKTAAEAASKAAADASKAAGNDATEAKKAAGNAEAGAKRAIEKVETAKGEMQKQLDEAIEKIEQARQQAQKAILGAQEAKAAAAMAQKMVKEVGNAKQPELEGIPNGGDGNDAAKLKFDEVKKKAEQGDKEAQNDLGCMYENGEGVEKDELMAVCWYQKSAKQGYALAQYNLGLAYYFSRGVDANYTKAVYWYRKAAEQEYAAAENNLGVALEYGQGCEKNEQEALEWYRKAASHGDAMGRKNMGEIYEKGKFGVEVDLVKARELYQKVVDDPNADEKPKKLAREGLDRITKLQGGK